MDFITQQPRTNSGHDAIFVIVDKLTKMCCFVATSTTATAEQTSLLNHVWKLHRVPKVIISDRDPLFTSTSQFTRARCNSLGAWQGL
jgi:hypothetical protein